MQKKLAVIIISSLILSCTESVTTRNVALESLLDDNSSKVWLVDKAFENGINISPQNRSFREIIIFYSNRNICLQPLNSLGNQDGDKGIYEADSDLNLLTFNFKKEKWMFKIDYVSSSKLILKPLNISACQYTLELIPLPEL